jgi:hypothetical protein
MLRRKGMRDQSKPGYAVTVPGIFATWPDFDQDKATAIAARPGLGNRAKVAISSALL